MTEYPELDRLLSRYFDGSIEANELAALEGRLITDDAFAEQVSRWCLLHRQVSELLTETKLHALMDHFVKGSPSVPKDALLQLASTSTRQSGPKRSKSWLSLRQLFAWGAVAASLLALAAWTQHLRKDSNSSPAPTTFTKDSQSAAKQQEQNALSPQQVVATLTQVEDCVWEPGAPALHHGQQLVKGDQIALRSGMVKVTFDCGAEVVLEGPCDFWLHSPMIGFLT